MELNPLEMIVVVSVGTAAMSTVLGGIMGVYTVVENAQYLYSKRKKDYELQEQGKQQRDYILDEPSKLEAYKDSFRFFCAFVNSFSRVSLSNYDLDANLKKRLGVENHND